MAPKTWKYLETYAQYLDKRKSKIYKSSPDFSIFGVGSYTFAPWKIAICGLYKKLYFRLIGEIEQKPVVFDDTVYFLSFDDKTVVYKGLPKNKSFQEKQETGSLKNDNHFKGEKGLPSATPFLPLIYA